MSTQATLSALSISEALKLREEVQAVFPPVALLTRAQRGVEADHILSGDRMRSDETASAHM